MANLRKINFSYAFLNLNSEVNLCNVARIMTSKFMEELKIFVHWVNPSHWTIRDHVCLEEELKQQQILLSSIWTDYKLFSWRKRIAPS